MKYLVLGSSGQIGIHLIDFLKSKNVNTLSFDIVNSKYEDLRIYNNILLEKYIDEADFIYFLAFDVGGSRYLQQYQNTFNFLDNNIKLMDNTFSLLQKYKKPFIFTSSQMSNMNYSSYGTLKKIGEHYTEALNGIIVKFWNVYGIEHDDNKSHVITDFVKKALKTQKINMLTDGTEERQFLYADDCSNCLFTLSNLFSQLDKKTEFHITSFEWTNILNIAKEIQKNIKCDIIPNTSKDNVQLNKKNDPSRYILNFWKPEISLELGIKKICDYYKGNKYE